MTKQLIPPEITGKGSTSPGKGASVLEIGCSTGELLANLQPKRGVGIDISPKIIERARDKHAGRTELGHQSKEAEHKEHARQPALR